MVPFCRNLQASWGKGLIFKRGYGGEWYVESTRIYEKTAGSEEGELCLMEWAGRLHERGEFGPTLENHRGIGKTFQMEEQEQW